MPADGRESGIAIRFDTHRCGGAHPPLAQSVESRLQHGASEFGAFRKMFLLDRCDLGVSVFYAFEGAAELALTFPCDQSHPRRHFVGRDQQKKRVPLGSVDGSRRG